MEFGVYMQQHIPNDLDTKSILRKVTNQQPSKWFKGNILNTITKQSSPS